MAVNSDGTNQNVILHHRWNKFPGDDDDQTGENVATNIWTLNGSSEVPSFALITGVSADSSGIPIKGY